MTTSRCRLVSCFTKGDKLGEGTYGSVYQARDKETGRLVALKRVKEKTFEREGMPQTSLREIALLRKLKHPNIVSLLEVVVGSKADSIFLVFEYCGFELAQLVDSLPSAFPLAEIKCVIRQLLSAVAHMHSNGVIHRDLKLSNLLLSDHGALKLCDFGLARDLYPPASDGEQGATYTPRVVTLWYRSPELLLGATRYGAPVDLWSVGCILGELLLHRPLLPAGTELKQLEMICELLGTPSTQIWPGLVRLPHWEKLRGGLPEQPYNDLAVRFAKLNPSQGTLDLTNALLTYDPTKRISAAAALQHRWLCIEPPAPARSVHSVVALAAQRKRRSSGFGSSSSTGGGLGAASASSADAFGSGGASRGLKRPLAAESGAAMESSRRRSSFSAGTGMPLGVGAAPASVPVAVATVAAPAANENDLSGSARIPSPDGVMTTTARQC